MITTDHSFLESQVELTGILKFSKKIHLFFLIKFYSAALISFFKNNSRLGRSPNVSYSLLKTTLYVEEFSGSIFIGGVGVQNGNELMFAQT